MKAYRGSVSAELESGVIAEHLPLSGARLRVPDLRSRFDLADFADLCKLWVLLEREAIRLGRLGVRTAARTWSSRELQLWSTEGVPAKRVRHHRDWHVGMAARANNAALLVALRGTLNDLEPYLLAAAVDMPQLFSADAAMSLLAASEVEGGTFDELLHGHVLACSDAVHWALR